MHKAVVGAVVVLGVTAVLVANYVTTRGHLVITNRSENAVTAAKVAVCEDVYPFKAIAPGKSVTLIHAIPGDCHYTLSATFADGTALHSDFGYVTSGAATTTRVDIDETGAIVRRAKRN